VPLYVWDANCHNKLKENADVMERTTETVMAAIHSLHHNALQIAGRNLLKFL